MTLAPELKDILACPPSLRRTPNEEDQGEIHCVPSRATEVSGTNRTPRVTALAWRA